MRTSRGWLTGDVDYEIVDGVLTANIARVVVVDVDHRHSRQFQSDDPGGLRAQGGRAGVFRRGASRLGLSARASPTNGASDAAIRICYEPRGGEAVTMRMVNNRTFSQFVYVNPPGGWDDDVEGPALAVSLVGGAALGGEPERSRTASRVFMPPLRGATVSVPRPQGGIPHDH